MLPLVPIAQELLRCPQGIEVHGVIGLWVEFLAKESRSSTAIRELLEIK
jgi:hypothetical protein